MEFKIKNSTCLHDRCTFDLVNGGCLVGMGVIGFFLSVVMVLCLKFNIVKLSGPKNLFMMNIAINDAMVGLVAVIRGLGIISEKVVGVNEDMSVNNWCYVFLFLAHFVWNTIILVQLPLAIDWFISLVFPHKYNQWITRKISWIMTILSWAPMTITHLIYDPIIVAKGTMIAKYQVKYNRCVFGLRPLLPVIALLVPLVVLIIMYSVITVSIYKNRLPVSRLLATTSAIVFSGLLVVLPQILLTTTTIEMSYEAAQIFTVTLYHTICIVNPLIYFIANPRVIPQIRARKRRLQKSIKGAGAAFSFIYVLANTMQGVGMNSPRQKGAKRLEAPQHTDITRLSPRIGKSPLTTRSMSPKSLKEAKL